MKHVLLFWGMMLFSSSMLYGQLPNGSIAPDWTLTDINDNSHHLYAYLDSGYTVFLDFSATWCSPCWNYHNSGALENLYNQYGPNGTNEVRVFFIEASASTNTACLYGSAGCNSSTYGNWVAGTPYPIIDDASQNGAYDVPWFPTIYGICSNHEITYLSQPSTAAAYAFHNSCPAPASLDIVNVNTISVDCNGESTGAIDITVTGGSGNYTYQWSNGATSEDLSNIPAGSYSVNVSEVNGNLTVSGGPYIVEEESPLVLSQSFYQPVSCNNGGNNGMAEFTVSGGVPDYIYTWSNGQFTPILSGVGPGTYVLEVTDNMGCTTSESVVFESPDYPIVNINENIPAISCTNSTVTLDASGSAQGPNLTYLWTTNDGVILTGQQSLFATVAAGGTYTLSITNNTTECMSSSSVTVLEESTPPNVVANFVSTEILTCAAPTLDIVGSSTTAGAVFSWTGPNGFSSSNPNITVSVEGDYTLTVTDPSSGCTASTTLHVLGGTNVPNISAEFPNTNILTCETSFLDLVGSSTTPNVTFSWVGPNGFSASSVVIVVTVAGEYTLTVTDPTNGCVASTTVTVLEESSPPNISIASANPITCAFSSTVLVGNSSTSGVEFDWVGPNGFMASGATISVAQSGNYTLTVTNVATGCTANATTTVVGDMAEPENVAINTNGPLDCNNENAQLQGSSSTNDVVYSWQTPLGITMAGSLITVDVVGVYILTVTNPTNGCSATASYTLVADITTPDLSVMPQNPVLTCEMTCVDLSATSNGAVAYVWTGPNGFTGTSSNITACMPGSYEVIVTGGNGCTNQASIQVSTSDALGISCETITNVTTLGGSDGAGGVTVTNGTAPFVATLNGNTQTITAIGGSAQFQGLSSGTYTVNVTDAGGCTASCTFSISEPGCTLTLSETHQNESCTGNNNGSINLTAEGGNGTITYVWSNGMTTEDISGLGAGSYSVVATDASGCQASKTVVITSTPPVTPTFTQVGPICGLEMLVTLPNISNENIEGTWNPNPIVPANGSQTATFTPNGDECATTTTMFIQVNAPISPSFALFGPYCLTDESFLLPFTSPEGLTGTWTPSVLNPADGNQNIVWDADGGQCALDYEQFVVVEECGCPNPPTVDAGDPIAICANEDIVLNGAFGGEANMATWSGGNGTFSPNNTTMNASYNPTDEEITQGSFTLTLTTDDPDGNGPCMAVSSIVQITINPLPIITFEPIPDLCSDGDPHQLVANPTGGTWSGAGIVGSMIDPTTSGNGMHSASYQYEDDNGCSNSITTSFNVIDCGCISPPTTNAGSPQIICSGSSVQLSGVIGGTATSVTWSGGLGTFAPSNHDLNAIYTATAAEMAQGAVNLLLTTNDPDGNGPCEAAESDVLITFGDLVVDPGNYDALCEGGMAIELHGTPIGGVWSGEGVDGNTFSPPITGTGTFVLTYSYTSANGCADTVTTQINVLESPSLTLISSGELCCNQSTVVLSASATGCNSTNYLWSTGETTSSITVDESGEYSVTAICASGCATTVTVEVAHCSEITSFDVDVANASGETISDGSAGITNIAGGTGPYTVQWFFNGQLISVETNLVNALPGEYIPVVTDANGCSFEKEVNIGFITAFVEPIWASGLQIYPNPNTGVFYVELDHSRRMRLMVQNTLGQIIYEYEGAPFGKITIDLSNVPAGTYLLKLSSEKEMVYRKITIE